MILTDSSDKEDTVEDQPLAVLDMDDTVEDQPLSNMDTLNDSVPNQEATETSNDSGK